ncbi:MAG: hypothetical protein AABZ92_04985, partial [Verrucomicrobiota bacterium]
LTSGLSLNPSISVDNVKINTLIPKEPLGRGFVPVMPKIFHHYTDAWYKGYRWQTGHPIRQKALDKFSYNRFLAYLIARLDGTVCTVSAYNIFSIFVEYSKRSQDNDFIKGIGTCKYEEKGLEKFKELINSILGLKGQKGMACLCSIGNSFRALHEFVIELTPAGKLYIYQSYQGQYSLEKCFKKQKALDPSELFDKLEILISEEKEPTPERVEAYRTLFHATDTFQKLDFFFIPLEYAIESIPLAPISQTFAQRMGNIWLRFIANIQGMLSNLATRIQRL